MTSNTGVVCSEADLQQALEDPLSVHCLTRGETMGLMLIAESGIISLLAVVYVFGIIIRNAFRRRKEMGRKWRMFEEPTDILLASLFAIDGIQSIGAVFNVVWLNRGKLEVGGYCEAQGIFKQLGEVGVAFNTMLITVYTFSALWIGRQIRSMRLTAILVTLAWVAPILLVLIGNLTTKEFHGPVPMWCWITKKHPVWRLMGEYLWMWLALGLCILMYIPIYFWNRGNLVPHEHVWWKFHIRSAKRSQIDCELRRKSFVMLLYPITYSIVIIPLTIVRWITFAAEKSGDPMPMYTGATVLAGVLFASSGALNVLLYLRTRPDTALFRHKKRESAKLPCVQKTAASEWNGKVMSITNSNREDSDDLHDIETLGRLPSTASSLQR